jgi:hypothetical protein
MAISQLDMPLTPNTIPENMSDNVKAAQSAINVGTFSSSTKPALMDLKEEKK